MLGTVDRAEAASILRGSDYLTTLPGTFFDFPGIGVVPLEGRPIGPGNTDTIVQRQANAILPTVGSSDTIPIEMVALSLHSVNPVNVTGSFFDVFVHLTPSTRSIGTMTIHHEFPDNGTAAPEGTFSSFFDIFFTVELTPVGPGVPTSFDLQSRLTGSGAWSHEPEDPNPILGQPPLLIISPPGSQADNLHRPLPPGFNDFFIAGFVDERHEAFAGLHRATQATVPGPTALTLIIAGSLLAVVVTRGSHSVPSRKGHGHDSQFAGSMRLVRTWFVGPDAGLSPDDQRM